MDCWYKQIQLTCTKISRPSSVADHEVTTRPALASVDSNWHVPDSSCRRTARQAGIRSHSTIQPVVLWRFVSTIFAPVMVASRWYLWNSRPETQTELTTMKPHHQITILVNKPQTLSKTAGYCLSRLAQHSVMTRLWKNQTDCGFECIIH